ncbi:hypothetical protein RRG08_053613 [Elysia crispata]|uniref:Uncharacterized protein n=1 Tax=Elysia crispata TaxID=231223 RepID=A0AAE0Y183_9GAST|nr:hypothetical protein RRG08_053613 [Elysia crispata]
MKSISTGDETKGATNVRGGELLPQPVSPSPDNPAERQPSGGALSSKQEIEAGAKRVALQINDHIIVLVRSC